jgi:gliding motility associated protien GldN
MLVSWDSSATTEDPNNPGVFISAPTKNEVTTLNVWKYWVKEDWFFDKQRSVMDVRIIGLCALEDKLNDDGSFKALSPMFWIYYPEARYVFANAEVFNRNNDSERRTLEDIIWKRDFSSFVYKEANVYDRDISEYKSGMDALLEAEKIKENIFNYEHDMWEY